MSQPTDVGRPPLVGRARELERIAAALTRPGCSGVVLLGPAGVGKTRLADEGRQLAESAGMAVVAATANETSARLSLGALAHLLPPASELADLHQDLQPAQLLQAARASLAERAGGRPLVISIDDAHHLDAVAAHLVGHLAATEAAFVVLTVRAGEPVPPALASLWKDGTVERIDLGALDDADIGPMAEGLLGSPLDVEAAAWLAATSAGNALFLRELALGGREDGMLVHDGQRWRLADAHPMVSARLTELVAHRLEGLSIDERRVVELIALAEPIGLEVIEELVGVDMLDALDRRGLVRVVADGRRLGISLTHPLYVEALRRGRMSIRLRADLGAVASTVLGHGARRREDPVRVAGWQLSRGGRADPEVIFRAALAAQLNLDDHAAVELSTAGLAQQPTPTLRAELHLCRGLAKNRLGRFVEASADLHEALALADSPDQVSRSAVRLAAAILERDGDLHGAVAVLDDAIARLANEAERVHVRLERATLLADAGRPELAREELERVPTAELNAEARVLWSLADASGHLAAGRPASAIRSADEGLHFHLQNLEHVSTYHPSSHFLPRILGLIDLGDLDRAEHDSEWIRRRGEAERRLIGVTGGRVFTAMVHLRRGRPNEAARLARQAIDGAHPQAQAYLRRLAWATLTQALALSGDGPGAAAALATFEGFAQVIDGFGAVESLLAPARVASCVGRKSDASTLLWRGVDDAAAHGHARVVLAGLDELVHAHRDREAAHRLRSLATDGEGPLHELRVAQATALADPRSGFGALDEVAQQFAALGMHLRAAEVAAAAAEQARLDGDPRAAVRCERFVAEQQARCDVGVSAAIAGVGAATPLTEREREIAVLVGRGASSKEVAATLFLSTRTVDNHLQRIYSKLGVSNRRDLAAAIGSGG